MIVYLDLIFLFNLLIDGATLQTTAWTRKIRVKLWRVSVAAFIGALYALFLFFPSMSFLFTFIVKCLFSFFMIVVAFGFRSIQHFLRNIAVFYFVNFVVAGGIFALHYFMQSPGEVMNGILFTHSGGMQFIVKVGSIVVVITFVLVLVVFRMLVNTAKRREAITQFLADVCVHIEGYEAHCTGLIDTGNHLYDPFTRMPVMIMEAVQWRDVLPATWITQIERAEMDSLVNTFGDDPFIWQDRIRFIPFKGVTRGTEFMLALKPDKVVIVHNDTETITDRVLIGLKGGKISADGTYRAIIHPVLVGI